MNWPTGVGGKGNEGVAGLVQQTPGLDRLRRADLRAAEQDQLRLGAEPGRRVRATRRSTSVTAAAAAAAAQMPADFRVSITNAPGKGVYPISSFTWLLLYENPKDKAQAKAMVDFMKWALTDGQKFAAELGYAPLPDRGREARDGGARTKIKVSHDAQVVLGRDDLRLPARDRARSRSSSSLHRRRDRLRADAAVGLSIAEVRLRLLAHDAGIRCRASSARCRSSGARCIRRSSRC